MCISLHQNMIGKVRSCGRHPFTITLTRSLIYKIMMIRPLSLKTDGNQREPWDAGRLKGAMSRFAGHLEMFRLSFSLSFSLSLSCTTCESILHFKLSLFLYCLVLSFSCFYLCKLLLLFFIFFNLRVILYFFKETQNSMTELLLANWCFTTNIYLFLGGLARSKLKTYFVSHQASRKLNLSYMSLFLLVTTI